MTDAPTSGSFTITEDGELANVQQATRDHPEGNRPRDADGRPLDAPPTLDARPSEAPPPERPRGPRRLTPVDE